MLSTVFNNQQRSGYEELLSYGPNYYKNLLEMDVNYRFAGSMLDIMADKLELLMNDQFIDFMDEPTLSRVERWLNISYDATKNLEDRRKTVKLFWNCGYKLCGRMIKSMVMSYTGSKDPPSVKMTDRLEISIPIMKENTIYTSDLIELIEMMKPAHILVEMLLTFTVKIEVHIRVKHFLYRLNACGTFRCGEKPHISTLGNVIYAETSFDINQITKIFDTTISGTIRIGGKLYNSTTGEVITDSVEVEFNSNFEIVDVLIAGEELSGIYPEKAVSGVFIVDSTEIGKNLISIATDLPLSGVITSAGGKMEEPVTTTFADNINVGINTNIGISKAHNSGTFTSGGGVAEQLIQTDVQSSVSINESITIGVTKSGRCGTTVCGRKL